LEEGWFVTYQESDRDSPKGKMKNSKVKKGIEINEKINKWTRLSNSTLKVAK
jgi:hypothetical protein